MDFKLTNSVQSFQNSCALETGLSDFHKMTVTVLNSNLEKNKIKPYLIRTLVIFNNFRTQILRDFSALHISSDSSSLDPYGDISIRALYICTPKNKMYHRANNSPHR